MRHAKSSWDEPDLSDFERPLNERGRKAVELIANVIVGRQYDIGTIISSPAKRAAETAIAVRDIVFAGREIRFVDTIYESSPQTLSMVLAALSDEPSSVLLVGHNPGIEGFIRLLTARNETMPTAALAVIDTSVQKWSELMPGCGTLVEVLRPKELQQHS